MINARKEFLLGISAAAIVFGASYTRSASAADSGAVELEEIVVTAQRREESLSKTPLAVTAVSGEDLQKAGVVSVVELQYLAPSMQVQQLAQGVNISIRGVATADTTSKGQPGIQFNTDGVPVRSPEEQTLAMLDVQRVEVLSGPQGTLYGKSSTGGAVNVISNAPGHDEQASASIELGNYNTKRLTAMLNLPLGDSWAMRVAGAANSRTGYIKLLGDKGNASPDMGDEGNVAGRLSLSGNLTDNIKLRFIGNAGKFDAVGFANPSVKINSKNEIEPTLYGAWNPVPAFVRDHFQRGSLLLDADVGPVHAAYLGSISHYLSDNQQSSITFGAGQAPDGNRLLVNNNYDTDYHELRFSNREAGKLEWVAGFNYYTETSDAKGHIWSISAPPATPCTAGSTVAYCMITAAGGDPFWTNNANLINVTTFDTVSAFAHGVYELVPDWHLTVGVRQSKDKVARVGTFRFGADAQNAQRTLCINGQDCVYGNGPGNTGSAGLFYLPNNVGSAEKSKFVWNVGLDHQLSPSQFIYGRVATGYKAGSFNDFDGRVGGGFSAYDPEEMISYELGYKVRTGWLDFTSSVYFYDYSNNQINGTFTFITNGAAQNVGLTLGVPTQMYGWENSLRVAVTADDLVTFGADLEKSKYNGSILFNNIQFQGQELNRVPDYVLSAGYTHTFHLSNGATVAAHLDTRASAAYYLTNNTSGIRYTQPAFTRSNANLVYTSESGKFETTLFVSNIEDDIQATGAPATIYASNVTFPTGYSFQGTAGVSQPRFYGIRQSVKF